MRIVFFTMLLGLSGINLSAHNSEKGDSCRFSHYVGIQGNQLLHQILAFNNSNQSISNPYLLNYALNNRNSGWGFHLGAGYQFQNSGDNDGITDRKTYINNLSARIGLDRLIQLNNRWQAGFSVDGLYQANINKTETKTVNFDTLITKIKTGTNNMGGGLRSYLRFGITKHILLGTEASVYFTTGKEKLSTEIIQSLPFGGGTIETKAETSQDVSNLNISVPVVVYLVVSF
ncbi:MAG: hypothetical protein KDC13_08170 [Bacteroidetes bacterium]|nr:hypothetical protein [Bacteroidota bacterium]